MIRIPSGVLKGPVLPARSDVWATIVVLPSVRLKGSWMVKEPFTVEEVVDDCLVNWPWALTEYSVTVSPGSVVPTNLGWWLAVIPSPLIPVSSAERIESVGVIWGPLAEIVSFRGLLKLWLPALSVVLASKV